MDASNAQMKKLDFIFKEEYGNNPYLYYKGMFGRWLWYMALPIQSESASLDTPIGFCHFGDYSDKTVEMSNVFIKFVSGIKPLCCEWNISGDATFQVVHSSF